MYSNTGASGTSDTDALLPKYEPAPEIIQHHHHRHHEHHLHSSEVVYGTTDTAATTAPERWNYHNVDRRRHRSGDGHEGDDSASVEGGMAKFFKFVFSILAFVVIVVTFSRFWEGDRNGPPDWRQPSPIPSQPYHPRPVPPFKKSFEERAREVLTSTPLIDGHDDLAIFIRGQYKNNITSDGFKKEFEKGGMPLNVDLPRLRSGLVGGAFWSAFVACPANASYDQTDSNYATAVAHTIEQIDVLKRLQEQYPRDFTSPIGHANALGTDVSGRMNMLEQWHATKSFFGPMSIEGLHQVLPSAPMSTLRQYYDLGVRMATLTWNCHNAFADAALVWNDFTEPPQVVNGIFRPKEGAITNRGRGVIKEMNRLGMIVDISHTSYWTQKAVLGGISSAPVVFSHSSAYSLCPHPRNVKDDILDIVPKSKSLVMVNFSPDFVSCVAANDTEAMIDRPHFDLPEFYENNNTIHQVARHVAYIGDRIGYDYVGLGSDFDGMGSLTPRGLDGVDKFPNLIAELLKMGVSDVDASKVVGGNLLRVWKDVDDVSKKMRDEGVVPGLDDGSGY